ncbi:Poly(ADP-ribose) glycohydrolase 1 [Ancistrocladus abbreviatus]
MLHEALIFQNNLLRQWRRRGEKMENREDLRSILPFLPLKLESSTLAWPSRVTEVLKSLSRGPNHSKVDSGEVLFLAISDIRDSLSLSSQFLPPSTGHGYSLFFDEFLLREESTKWFAEVIPAMANLLLRLPMLLASHHQNADSLLNGVETGLRLLEPQHPGIVILSQELIGAVLSCSFFCLFPTDKRHAKQLPMINFDLLFESLYESYHESQENKIKCLIHYLERICFCMPVGFVSYERKVLPVKQSPTLVTYPNADFWGNSVIPLCQFEVCRSGLIEDHLGGALEVDFANKYLGGGALYQGCVQEEIRFMINPELIAGMLFLPSMSDNEAIEIVGAERFSNYSGYASTFRFSGDHIDTRERDSMGRRNTRIIAIDALCRPGLRQYRLDCLMREVNKAFCGFLDTSTCQHYDLLLQDDRFGRDRLDNDGGNGISQNQGMGSMQLQQLDEDLMVYTDTSNRQVREEYRVDMREKTSKPLPQHGNASVVTGNWGCGAFGGDPEVKTIIQWLAASQALRPFISYYPFEVAVLQNLDQVSQWILSHKWTVGDLWNLLLEYAAKRAKGETMLGFFSWLVPSLSTH